MQNNSRKTIFTTVSIDKETGGLVEKICKHYSLKKAEVVKLAFRIYRQGKYQSRRCPRIGQSRTCQNQQTAGCYYTFYP